MKVEGISHPETGLGLKFNLMFLGSHEGQLQVVLIMFLIFF